MSLFSDEELEMNVEAGYNSSNSEISSSYNSDSGVSIRTPSFSSSSWSPSEFDNEDDSEYFAYDLNALYQTHSYAIVQAIQCLSDQNCDVVLNASAYLFQICKSGYVPFISQLCPDIFGYLKVSMITASNSKHLDILHCISGIVNYFSQSSDGAYLILHRGGLDILNGLLLFPSESVLYFCVTALHNVLLSHKTARSFVHRTTIAVTLIHLLNLSVEQRNAFQSVTLITDSGEWKGINPKFLAVLCDCLYILAYHHECTKKSFRELGGLFSLLQLILNSSYEKVLWTASRLLRVLSAWIPFKCDMLSHDPTLLFFPHCMECHSQRVSANALWTMRNLSDVVFDKLPYEVASNIVNQLLARLKVTNTLDLTKSLCVRDESSVSRCILGTLANLTCRNYAIKGYIVRHNGLDLIVRILSAELKHYKTISGKAVQSDESLLLTEFLSNLAIDSDKTKMTTSQMQNSNDKHLSSNSLSTVDENFNVSEMLTENNTSKQTANKLGYFSPGQFDEENKSSLTKPIYSNANNNAQNDDDDDYDTARDNKINATDQSNNPSLNVILDLLEGGLRCLSHLTTAHSELLTVHHYFSQQRLASKFLVFVGKIFFPTILQSLVHTSFKLSSSLMSDNNQSNRKCYPHQSNSLTTNSTVTRLDILKQLFQLIKNWTIIIRNLSLPISTESSTTATSTVADIDPVTQQNMVSDSDINSSKVFSGTTNSSVSSLQLWPHHLRAQLRYSVLNLVTYLRRISNNFYTENPPKELQTTLDAIHDLSVTMGALHSTVNPVINLHNNNNNNNNNSSDCYTKVNL